MPVATQRHGYKEVRFQQLRSFCALARLGSQAAAASALGIAQPTVWEQLHALEREYGLKLAERHGRGSRLTRAGQCLARLAAPLVEGIDSLKRNFSVTHLHSELSLTLAASPRILLEDLPGPLARYLQHEKQVRLSIWEARGEEIPSLVEAGDADVGITADPVPTAPHPWLVIEPLYELDLILITPKDHPLARKRHVRPRELRSYPLINSAKGGFPDPAIAAKLERLGVFRAPGRALEAGFASVVRRYVEEGVGIGLVPGILSPGRSQRLHERSMSKYFGRMPVNLVWRRGDSSQEQIRKLGRTISALLQSH